MSKIKNYEKQLVRATIQMWIEWGAFLDADAIESDVSRYTGNYNYEHRCDLANFIQKEIDKINK